MKTRIRHAMLGAFGVGIVFLAFGNPSALGDFEYSFVLKWGTGTSGSGNGEFNTAHYLDVDSSRHIYVADWWNARVQIFDSDGNFLGKFGSYGSGDGQFDLPLGVLAHSSGRIYVTDYYNCRVQVFDTNGNFLGKFGSSGSGDAQFNQPTGIAIDASGYINVADRDNHRLQVFASDLTFVGWWGGCVEHGDNIGHWHDPGSGHTPQVGFGDGELAGAYDVAFDASGYAYVTAVYVVQKLTLIPVYANINIDPDTINLSSKDKWLTCYIELPEGFDVMDIDGATVNIDGIFAYIGKEGWARAGANTSNIMDHDGDGILERMVKFDKPEVQDYLTGLDILGDVELMVTGELINGPPFVGTDIIRIIDKGDKQ